MSEKFGKYKWDKIESLSHEYYAGNEAEKKLDDQIRDTLIAEGNKVDMALFLQNQAILNMLRRFRDCKGYPVAEGYMGFVNGKYQLFATEGDYREFIGGNEDD